MGAQKKSDSACFGIHHVLTRSIRSIEDIDFPYIGQTLEQGDVCVTITDALKREQRM